MVNSYRSFGVKCCLYLCISWQRRLRVAQKHYFHLYHMPCRRNIEDSKPPIQWGVNINGQSRGSGLSSSTIRLSASNFRRDKKYHRQVHKQHLRLPDPHQHRNHNIHSFFFTFVIPVCFTNTDNFIISQTPPFII